MEGRSILRQAYGPWKIQQVHREALDRSGMHASKAQTDEARDVAAALAHAYLTDNRPPREALTKAADD